MDRFFRGRGRNGKDVIESCELGDEALPLLVDRQFDPDAPLVVVSV